VRKFRHIKLLAFQEGVIDQLEALLREGHREIGLTSGTGSGKTVMSMGFLSQVLTEMQSRTNIRLAVVLCHQTNIEVNWHWEKPTRMERPEYGPPIEIVDLTQKPRKDRTDALVEHMDAEEQPDPPVLIVTYATLRHAVAQGRLPDDLSHVLFVNDEAHHVPYQETPEEEDWDSSVRLKVSWADARMACAVRGATSLTVTATDFRANGDIPVHGDETSVVRVPPSVLIDEGCRPKTTEIRIKALRAQGTFQQMRSEERFRSEVEDEHGDRTGIKLEDADFDVLVQQWVEDGYPKAVFKTQSIFQASQTIAALLRNVPGLSPDEILDATGVEKSDKDRTEKAVRSEQNQTTDDVLDVTKSKFKAVVACQRFVEGTDWPFCSHVYVVGVPGSLVSILQVIGRAQRAKTRILHYEEVFPAYIQRSVCTFFVPRLDKEELTKRAEDLTKLSVLVGLCSENFDIGRHFLDINLSLRQAVRGLNVTWNVTPRWQREIERVVNLSDPERLKVVRHVLDQEDCLKTKLGKQPSFPEMMAQLMYEGGTTAMERIKHVVHYCNELAKRPEAPEGLHKAMEKSVRKIVKLLSEAPEDREPRVESLFRTEFEKIAEELGDMTVPFGDRYLGLKSELEKATLEKIDEKAKKVMASRPHYNKLTQEMIRWRDAHPVDDIPRDLSEIFGYPPGTYKRTRLQGELRNRSIPGQPDDVSNWRDFISDVGVV
jgi:superfamily II DNA or RNA helicase